MPALIAGARTEAVTNDDVVHAFEDLASDELDAAHDMLRAADVALRPFRCIADLKRFAPDNLPVMYAASQRAAFRREATRTAESAGGLWGARCSARSSTPAIAVTRATTRGSCSTIATRSCGA